MAIDRATSQQLAAEILSLLPDEEFRKHWPAALAAMVLFARNMAVAQEETNTDMRDLVAMNLKGMGEFVHRFHAMCADSSEKIREGNATKLQAQLGEMVLAARAQFAAEALKSTTEQLEHLNEEIRIHVGIEVRKALEVEMKQYVELKKSTVDATRIALNNLTTISKSADAAVDRLEKAVEAMSRMDRQRQLQKGFFRKLKELFFGESLSNSPASKSLEG